MKPSPLLFATAIMSVLSAFNSASAAESNTRTPPMPAGMPSLPPGVTAPPPNLSLPPLTPPSSPKESTNMEKCYGVVRAGKNDCASRYNQHSCAGHAEKDADMGEWMLLPKGYCDKLAGGTIDAPPED